jgi:hypothetical protein
MQHVVAGWRDVFRQHGVSTTDIEAIAPAMLPESFELMQPPDPI